jgi:hypothetical protein
MKIAVPLGVWNLLLFVGMLIQSGAEIFGGGLAGFVGRALVYSAPALTATYCLVRPSRRLWLMSLLTSSVPLVFSVAMTAWVILGKDVQCDAGCSALAFGGIIFTLNIAGLLALAPKARSAAALGDSLGDLQVTQSKQEA